jgi:hypothetical protein
MEQRTAIKRMLAKRPNMPVGEIERTLRRDYNQPLTRLAIASIRSDFRHTLMVLKRLGLVDLDLYPKDKRQPRDEKRATSTGGAHLNEKRPTSKGRTHLNDRQERQLRGRSYYRFYGDDGLPRRDFRPWDLN